LAGLPSRRRRTQARERSEVSDDEPHHAPRWLTWLTRISLVVGIGALIATVWIVGPSTILHHLKSIGWFFVVLVAIEMISSVLDGIAIYYMAHGKGRPTVRECVVAQIVGRGVNSVTPGGNLGEALKVGLLSKRCSTRRIVAAVMYVGLIGVVMSFAVVAVGSAVTAFWFGMPRVAMIMCLVGAVIAAVIAVGIVVLLRRGMLSTLSNGLARMRVISKQRRERWNETLSEVDARLRGADDGDYRRKAIAYVVVSHVLQKGLAYFTIMSAGYMMSPGQFLALLSAGVLIAWISTIVPMGLGLAEGGNAALFTLIGAPAALGLALALARRVNQVVFAAIGFFVLAADRVGTHVHGRITTRGARLTGSTNPC
jgi:uncharacterized protein (TIRG00374 family)